MSFLCEMALWVETAEFYKESNAAVCSTLILSFKVSNDKNIIL